MLYRLRVNVSGYRQMKLVKGFALVLLAVAAIAIGYGVLAIGYGLLALSGDKGAAVSVKALPQTKTARCVMPLREVTIDYSTYTIRQLKAAARGTGIKRYASLPKSDLIRELAAI